MGMKGSTPAASTMPFSINYLQTLKFFKKLDSQSIVIFRTWVPAVGYTSRESLNRHYFLVCDDALQHLHPLRPRRPRKSSHAHKQDTGAGALQAVVAVPGINKLRVVNTQNSSTPVASISNSRIISALQEQLQLAK
jgi:hypothetical protein